MQATSERRERRVRGGEPFPPVTVVWIDAEEAIVVDRLEDPQVRWFHSDVPVHRKSTAHVRVRPTTRHGGGLSQDAAEHDRSEHLRAFVAQVEEALAGARAVLVLGPGQVGGRLARELRRRGGVRVERELAARRTIPQLIERMRVVNGHPSPRLGLTPRPG
jgi:hypothetical protein